MDGPSIDGLYGLAGLEKSCSDSGARYRTFKRECECPALAEKSNRGEIFSIRQGRGACLAPTETRSADEICQEGFTEAYLSGHLEGLNRCLKTLLQFERTYLGFKVGEGTPATQVLALTRELDRRRGRLFAKLWPTAENFFFNSRVTLLVGHARVDADFVKALIDPPPIDTNSPYRVTFLEPQAEQVLETLGHPLETPLGLGPAPVSVAQRFDGTAALENAVGTILRDNLSAAVVAAGECRRRCLVRQIVSEGAGLRMTREKSYLGGVPYRDVLKIERGGVLSALVQFNLRGGVSAIVIVENQPDSERVSQRFTVFNRLWQEVGQVTLTTLENPDGVRDLARQVDARSRGGVVFCEPLDLHLAEKAGILKNIRRSSDEAPLLGWLGPAAAEFSSVRELVGGVLPASFAGEHGVHVAQTLLHHNPQAGLIPVGLSGCLSGYAQWSGRAGARGVRVVNLSGTDPIDAHACRTLYATETMFGSDKPFLWVVAAGNSGTENPVDRCPQNLRQENILVVAGSEGDSLWPLSDYGENYADIAAPVSSEGEDVGTSFSSPRVAALAVEIAERYPSFGPEKIRRVILESARIPFRPLPVRSKGLVDRAAALALAEQWERGPR